MGYHGVIRVMFESPSSFEVFAFDDVRLMRSGALEVPALFYYLESLVCLLHTVRASPGQLTKYEHLFLIRWPAIKI